MSYGTRLVDDVIGVYVTKTAALPPATGASEDLFSVTGKVLITGFFGMVTVAIPNEVLTLAAAFDPDDGGSDVALATATSVQNAAIGTWLSLNSTTGGALIVDLDVADMVLLTAPLAMWDGDIKVNMAGGGAIGTTARVEWGLTYLPLSATGAVIAV
jgi:hypothetical protein